MNKARVNRAIKLSEKEQKLLAELEAIREKRKNIEKEQKRQFAKQERAKRTRQMIILGGVFNGIVEEDAGRVTVELSGKEFSLCSKEDIVVFLNRFLRREQDRKAFDLPLNSECAKHETEQDE